MTLVLPPGIRLDRFLAEVTQEMGISRSKLQKLIDEGHVTGIAANLLKASFTQNSRSKLR
ncbi:MAG: S4 domain-containing protein [Turneriella sp.]